MENSPELNRSRVLNKEGGKGYTQSSEQSEIQRTAALAEANLVRTERARLKAAVGAGQYRASALIVNSPKCFHSMKVTELLRAQPRWGLKRAERVMTRADLSFHKTIGDLTWRQKNVLADLLEKQ